MRELFERLVAPTSVLNRMNNAEILFMDSVVDMIRKRLKAKGVMRVTLSEQSETVFLRYEGPNAQGAKFGFEAELVTRGKKMNTDIAWKSWVAGQKGMSLGNESYAPGRLLGSSVFLIFEKEYTR